MTEGQTTHKALIISIIASALFCSASFYNNYEQGLTSTACTRRKLGAISGNAHGEYIDMLTNIEDDNLEYHNLKEDGSLEPILSVCKEGGPVIATLVPKNSKDIDELKRALKSLKFLKGDTDPKLKAPVLIFNENNLSDDIKKDLATFTDRPVAFPIVDFSIFPTGFDPKNETVDFQVKGRDEWGYYQMMRFWVTGIWTHPAIKPFRLLFYGTKSHTPQLCFSSSSLSFSICRPST